MRRMQNYLIERYFEASINSSHFHKYVLKLCSEGRFKMCACTQTTQLKIKIILIGNSLKSNLPILHVLNSGSRFVALPEALCHLSPRTQRAGLTLRAVT